MNLVYFIDILWMSYGFFSIFPCIIEGLKLSRRQHASRAYRRHAYLLPPTKLASPMSYCFTQRQERQHGPKILERLPARNSALGLASQPAGACRLSHLGVACQRKASWLAPTRYFSTTISINYSRPNGTTSNHVHTDDPRPEGEMANESYSDDRAINGGSGGSELRDAPSSNDLSNHSENILMPPSQRYII